MQSQDSAAAWFLRHMLPRPQDPAARNPQPIVALLGPHGSGKTTLLDALALGCGDKIVHSRLDFAQFPKDTFEATLRATATTALLMSRKWPYFRESPTFHCFGLTLLAFTADLPQQPDQARLAMERLIHRYVQNTRRGRSAWQGEDRLRTVVDALIRLTTSKIGHGVDIADDAAELATQGIGFLLRRMSRRVLRSAEQWYKSIPALGGTDLIDALIQVNKSKQDLGVDHLIWALLADMTAHADRRPPIAHKCDCVLPGGRRDKTPSHEHAWVLLVDNADAGSGPAFLSRLAKIRCELADGRDPVLDPLLVVAACGKWRTTWSGHWYEPWHMPTVKELESAERQHVPWFTRATPEVWYDRTADDLMVHQDPRAAWYPMRVDPLDIGSTRTMVQRRGERMGLHDFGALAHKLSAGNPGTIKLLAEVEEAVPPESAKDWPSLGTLLTIRTDAPLWWHAIDNVLPAALPNAERPWREVPPAVIAAAYLADPDHVLDGNLPPSIGSAFTLVNRLKDELWISNTHIARTRLRTCVDEWKPRPALHPWLSRCLMAGLAGQSATAAAGAQAVASWDDLFRRLRAELIFDGVEPADGIEPSPRLAGRALYYDLALGDFTGVALRLAAHFNAADHHRWIRLIAHATSAPCRRPMTEPLDAAFDRLSADWQGRVPNPTPVQAAVAKLLALLWLYDDPLIRATDTWDKQVEDGFDGLIKNSTHLDVSPLKRAQALYGH